MSDFHTPGAQPPGAPQKRGLSGCVWAIIIVVGLLILFTIIGAIGAITGAGKSGNVAAPAATGTAAAPTDAAAAGTSWTYQTSKDEVRNITNSYATIVSDNKVDFDFPYNGGSTLQMVVRHDHYGENVYFVISKGQFVCGIESCGGEMNIDGTPRHLSLATSSDGSADTLFANGAGGIIKALKSAKKVIVELPFYQAGDRQFTFTTAKGLEWPPKSAADQPAK